MSIPGKPLFLQRALQFQQQDSDIKTLEFRLEESEELSVQKLKIARTLALEQQASQEVVLPENALGKKSYTHNRLICKSGKIVSLECQKSKELKKTYAVSCVGDRETQEDAHIAALFEATIGGKKIQVELTGVFDGHGDTAECSDYVAKNIASMLKEKLELFNKTSITNSGMRNALKQTFVQLHLDYKGKGGSCANICVKINNVLWTANTGDSRALLIKLNSGKITQLSHDQKASDPKYREGILKRGKKWAVEIQNGYICYGGYQLAVAKAIGNRIFPFMSARPKVRKKTLKPGQKYILVQTCDGVPDVMTTNHIGHFILQRKQAFKESLKKTTPNLVAAAIESYYTEDNVTAITRSFTV